MMTLSPSSKRILFNELRSRVDRGVRCPSLAWLAKFMRVETEADAEAVLRELERDGVITVLRRGPYPWVSVLRNSYGGPKVAGMTLDPERFDKFTDGTDVLKINPFADIEKAVTEIEATYALPDKMPPRKPLETAKVMPDRGQGAQPASPPVQGAETVLVLLPEQPQLVKAQHYLCGHPNTPENTNAKRWGRERCKICKCGDQKRRRDAKRLTMPHKPRRHNATMPAVPRQDRRQVNMSLPPEIYKLIAAEAAAISKPMGAVAIRYFMSGWSLGRTVDAYLAAKGAQ